jgi:rubrerythrin
MIRRELSPLKKRIEEQKKFTDLHGGPEVRIDIKGKYFCLQCGSYICDEGYSKLYCPGCGKKLDWNKYIIETPVL